MRKFLYGVAIILFLGIAGPYLYSTLSLEMLDPVMQDKRGATFAELEAGRVNYKISGPEDGPMVVAVHGFSTPSFVFRQSADMLAENGFRVLQFDHFGRGWSDRPDGPYSAQFYVNEIDQLMDAIGIDQPVNMIGYSMGGIVSAHFTNSHPDRVKRLFLVAPAGLGSADDLGSIELLKTPLLGNWLWTVFGRSILLEDPQYDESDLDEDRRLAGNVAEQMNYTPRHRNPEYFVDVLCWMDSV